MRVCSGTPKKATNPEWKTGNLYARKLEVDQGKVLTTCEIFIAAGATDGNKSLVCLQDGLYWSKDNDFSSDIWVDVTEQFCLLMEDKNASM